MGLGPWGVAKMPDRLCVSLGRRCSVVLRLAEGGFDLVGGAVVHRMMSGKTLYTV